MTDHPPLPVIVCFKWGKGYPVIYTNVLFRALSDIMSVPFRFVCLTDHPDGLDDGIDTIDLPEFALEREHWVPGMWPKLCAFKPGLFKSGTPVIMLDVDIVPLKDLTPMIEHVVAEGGLHIIADWPDTLERWFPKYWIVERLSNSSVVGFTAGEQDHIFEAFRDKKFAELKKFTNDQEFIHHHAKGHRYWPLEWVLSFKKSLSFHFPVNFVRPIRRPDKAFIVAFHGKPDPEDLSQGWFKRWGTPEKFGYFPVSWVKSYWLKYTRT